MNKPWVRIRHFYYDCKYIILNVWHHRKALLHSRPWDYHGTLLFMRDNLKYLSDSIEKHGCHLNKGKQVKDIRICVNLLERLLKDDYMISKHNFILNRDDVFQSHFIPKYFLPKGDCHKLTNGIQKYDQELLFKLLNKHIRTWWD